MDTACTYNPNIYFIRERQIDLQKKLWNTLSDDYPKEKRKTFAMTLLLCFAAALNVVVLSFIHEKVPETEPLPDLIFTNVPHIPIALRICEYIMISSFVITLLFIIFHRHRWIIFRRLVTIGSILYLLRCVTLLVTQLPLADKEFTCAPKMKENATFWKKTVRGLSQISGLGLNVQDKGTHLCGDYIYSGHTIVLILSALFVTEYSPKSWRVLHVVSWLYTVAALICLIISRGHYTIDVIISYFLCTRTFWNYHALAAHRCLRESASNYHKNEFWYPLFCILESNIHHPIPYHFECPLPSCLMNAISSTKRKRESEAHEFQFFR